MAVILITSMLYEKQKTYKLAMQLLNPKQSSSSERAHMDARSGLPKLNFHLEIGTPTYFVIKYYKEEFLQSVK